MLDDLDDQTEWIKQLTRDYRHSHGPGRSPRDTDLTHLIDVAGQLAAAHDEIADEYRKHVDVMTERLRRHQTTSSGAAPESSKPRDEP